MGLNILHLSDLHFGHNSSSNNNNANNNIINSENLLSMIVSSLENNKIKIDVVIITGDIFDKLDENYPSMVEQAVEFFNSLYSKLNNMQKQLSKEDFFFVPGNHDILRNAANSPWEPYDKLLKNFYSTIPNYYIPNNHVILKKIPSKKILFMGFNSNSYDTTFPQKCKPIISNQFDIITKYIDNNNLLFDYYKIAFLHHPFYLFTQTEGNTENGTLHNAEEFLTCLSKWKVNLVLHGHKHEPKNTILLHRGITKINVFAAGSMVNPSGEPSFNIVEIKEIAYEPEQTELSLWKLTLQQQHFNLTKDKLDDPFEGMLCDMLKRKGLYPSESDPYCSIILNIINELYILYDPLLYLENNINAKLLLFSIKSRIKFHENQHMPTATDLKQEFVRSCENSPIPDSVFAFLCTGKNKININKQLKIELESNIISKRYTAVTLLAIYFTDLYWDFVKSGKAKFIKNGIKYDILHKYIFLNIQCINASYYSDLTNLINDFRIFLDKITHYFCSIQIKIKGIIPEIISADSEISFQDFDASIPRLIPLLTGTNIYASDKVFTRELVQNAIDAVSFREKYFKQNNNIRIIDPIHIQISKDENGDFFKIIDTGIGMRQEIIERYFTTLGKSYYNEANDIATEHFNYNPISNFGIGFLSAFKPCKKIIIETKHCEEDLFHRLEIKDGQDFFIIHSERNTKKENGTSITCYFKDTSVKIKSNLQKYLENIMLDIKYPICFDNDNTRIEDRAIRRQWQNDGGNILFIPFNEDTSEVPIMANYSDITPEKFINTYRHGMLIRPKTPTSIPKPNVFILNAGILMEDSKLEDIFCLDKGKVKLQYTEVVFNFPPHWLEIDVSREKASKLTIKDINGFKENLFSCFANQWTGYQTKWKDTKLAAIFEIETFMEQICSQKLSNPLKNILLQVRFEQLPSISFTIKRNAASSSTNNKLTINHDIENNKKNVCTYFNQAPQDIFAIDDFSNINRILETGYQPETQENFKKLLGKLGLFSYDDTTYLPVILAACLNSDTSQTGISAQKIRDLVEKTIFEEYSIHDLNNSKTICVSYNNDNIIKYEMNSDNLSEIIQNIAEDFMYYPDAEPDSDAYKYDFIWEELIYKEYKNYYPSLPTDTWRKIRTEGQKHYHIFKNALKKSYGEGSNPKIDEFMIASCYMSALLQIEDELLNTKNNDTTTEKCINRQESDPKAFIQNPKSKWALDSGLSILHMWKLSEYKNSKPELYHKLSYQKKLLLPSDLFYHNFTKLLSLKENTYRKSLNLCFTELFRWITLFNEKYLAESS